MGRIGYSSVTLTDLTETLPVTLVLETSLDQNIQTKVGNLYTPNFSDKEKELIITPSLFLGQEEILFREHPEYLKPENETDSGYLYYEIGEDTYKWDGSTSGIYVDEDGKLHYNLNLIGNTRIEAYIKDFYNPSHNFTVDLVQATNPIDILFLEEGNNNYYAVIECSNGREHFEDTNADAITMTVKLYQGLINLLETRLNDFEIKWDKLSDGDSNIDSTATQLIVERGDITNRELFTCEIKDKATEITYIAQQFIYDFTDQYNCVITYDKPLLLSEENTEVNLSAAVWYKNERLENKEGYKLSYRWMVVGEKDGGDKNLSGNESTIKISSNDINIPQKQAFTVLCQVLHTDSAETQYIIANGTVTFQWIPSYSVRISPKDIFVVTGSDGSYQGNSNRQYTFSFQLIDKQGNLIDYDISDDQSESISAGTNSDGTKITFSNPKNNKWDFTGTITLSNALWSSTDGSRAYEFTYVYYGQQFTDEINIIKNKTGEQGIQGFSGYTIDLANEFHAFSGGESRADTDQNTSCKISAHYGDQNRDIEKITIGSAGGTIIYQKDKTISEIEYTVPNSKGYLFVSTAVGSNSNEVNINIRTNKSTVSSEKGMFLTGIEPINFYITIAGQSSSLTFLKTFTYTINYNGKSYYLNFDYNSIKYAEATGEYTPEKITVSALYRETTGAANTYINGKIIYSFDNEFWQYLGASGSITGYKNLENIYVRLYSSQASITSSTTINEDILTSNASYILDMEIIPILTSLEGYQIGGENLLRWSKEMPVEANKWSQYGSVTKTEKENFSIFNFSPSTGSIFAPVINFVPEMINNTLTFSCYVKVSDWSKFGGITFLFAINENFVYSEAIRQTSGEVVLGGNYFNHPSSHGKASIDRKNGEWCKFIWTFKVVDGHPDDGGFFEYVNPDLERVSVKDAKYCTIGVWETGSDPGSGIQIKKMKLEYGNVATEWSASPYDVTYENINGSNLISNDNINPYNFTLKAGEEIRLTTTLLTKQTLYTLSWLSSLSSSLNSFGWTAKKEDGTILGGGNFSVNNNNFQYTFPTYEEDWNLFFYGDTYDTATKQITYYTNGEILFSSIKLEKGATATSFILNSSQINQIVKTSTNDLSNTIFSLPIIEGSQSSQVNFTSSQDFIDFITTANETKAQVETNSKGVSLWDDWYNNNDELWKAYKNSIELIVAEEDGGPYIKIQTANAEGAKLTNNYLKLEANILGFYSNDILVASMSQSTLTIENGVLVNVRAKENFYIGDLRFRITDSGVGIVWS